MTPDDWEAKAAERLVRQDAAIPQCETLLRTTASGKLLGHTALPRHPGRMMGPPRQDGKINTQNHCITTSSSQKFEILTGLLLLATFVCIFGWGDAVQVKPIDESTKGVPGSMADQFFIQHFLELSTCGHTPILPPEQVFPPPHSSFNHSP